MAHVHLSADFNPEFLAVFSESPFDHMAKELASWATLSQGGSAPVQTTILVAGRLEPGDTALPHLETVLVPFAGIPAALAESLRTHPHIQVVNLHFNAAATAEMAVALLLSAARGIVPGDIALRKGRWRGRQEQATNYLLAGKTATILGFGEVGRRVGAILKPLGMKVIGVRRTFDAAEPEVYGVDRLHEALAHSHVLVVAAPGTPDTEGLIGKEEIERLQPPRMIINVGRASIIQEQALFEACRDGVVARAGLDVWYQYPSGQTDDPTHPSQYPIHELENVTLSPHRAGTGDDTERLRTEDLIRVLKQILSGKSVKYVDLERQY